MREDKHLSSPTRLCTFVEREKEKPLVPEEIHVVHLRVNKLACMLTCKFITGVKSNIERLSNPSRCLSSSYELFQKFISKQRKG